MAKTPEAESTLQETAITPEMERHLMFDVPDNLTPHHPIENELGTWHIAGEILIFDAGVHSYPKKQPVPYVTDINAFASGILEEQLEKLDRNRKIEDQVHERLGRIPNLHVRSGLRRVAVAIRR